MKGQLQLPLYVKPQISFSANGGRVNVMVGCKMTQLKTPIEDVVVTVPFTKSVSTASLSATHGSVTFDDITKVTTTPTSPHPHLTFDNKRWRGG